MDVSLHGPVFIYLYIIYLFRKKIFNMHDLTNYEKLLFEGCILLHNMCVYII